MRIFLEIECVKKENGLVTEIYGLVAPNSSDKQPTKERLKAIYAVKVWQIYYKPKGEKENLIRYPTHQHTVCFVMQDPENPSKNYLDRFPECKQEN